MAENVKCQKMFQICNLMALFCVLLLQTCFSGKHAVVRQGSCPTSDMCTVRKLPCRTTAMDPFQLEICGCASHTPLECKLLRTTVTNSLVVVGLTTQFSAKIINLKDVMKQYIPVHTLGQPITFHMDPQSSSLQFQEVKQSDEGTFRK